ncbi:FCD domain-containing protein [Testudinibacter sp. P80/BLE/0925]|uniref:FCD domain-containing protein n=1 Tax=Testudinibacter sp. TW-1 TaxID=3417757 RepID=UPI003D36F634
MKKYIEIGLDIINQISDGKFNIGDKLPTEKILMAHYGVARTTIRESITMLEVGGYLDIRQGSGMYIASLKPNGLLTGDSSYIDLEIGPFEMLQARQILESNIAHLAARKATKSDIVTLKEILVLERQNVEHGNFEYDTDLMFHLSIARATHNLALVDMVKDIWQRRQRSMKWNELHRKINHKDYRSDWLSDHQEIYMALQRKEPDSAYEKMWTHLENVKNRLFEHSDIDDPNFDGFIFRD